MKKLLLLSLALVSFSSVFAQTEAGSITVGASSNLGFTSVKVKDAEDATTVFRIAPQAGYFVIDNLAVGLAVDFTSEKQGDFKDTSFAGGPFARYYFLEDKIRPFAQAQFLFGSTKEEGGSFENKATFTALGVGAGVAFFLNDNISLDAGLNYNANTVKPDVDGADDVKSNAFGLQVGFSLFF